MTEHKITITIDTKPALEAIAVIKTALADLTVSGVPKQKLADEEYENDFLPIWDNWETAIAEGRATKKGNIKPAFKVQVEADGVVGGFGLGEQGEDIKVEGDRGETIKTPSTPTDAYDQLQMVVELEARISSVLTLMKGYRHNWQHTAGHVTPTVNGKSIAKMTRQIENILTGKPLQS